MKKQVADRKGFTLVELMIVVALIALLTSIAVPNFMRARKRAQAVRMLEDLRMLDGAMDQYAIEHSKLAGASASFTDLMSYLKTASSLYNSGGTDVFGNAYNDGLAYTVDGFPKVNTVSYNSLSDVAPSEFWSPYR